MPEDLALFVLLVLALAVGFLLGRRDWRRRRPDLGGVTRDYFAGLDHQLNERHDLAIDSFVESMAVDNDTVDTHLALGSLVRRRGEVDQAIRIHQNLLARPVLSGEQRRRVELELARDYLMAGLLDRAERLLIGVAEKRSDEQARARELLLEIYQREKEWAQAVTVGLELAKADGRVRGRLAHFECELAEEHLAAGELEDARAALERGARHDGRCARLKLLEGRVDFAAHRYREACAAWRQACELDGDLAAECLEGFREACEKLGDVGPYGEFLETLLDAAPSLDVIEALAVQRQRERGREASMSFRAEALTRHPSLGGLVARLEQLDGGPAELASDELAALLEHARALLAGQQRYRCRQCGFGSQTLMWQCPSCRGWAVLKPAGAQLSRAEAAPPASRRRARA